MVAFSGAAIADEWVMKEERLGLEADGHLTGQKWMSHD